MGCGVVTHKTAVVQCFGMVRDGWLMVMLTGLHTNNDHNDFDFSHWSLVSLTGQHTNNDHHDFDFSQWSLVSLSGQHTNNDHQRF
jgi:hypothetical protein